MAVVAPFIRPSSGSASYAGWTQRIAFGQDQLPTELSGDPDRCSGLVHLEVTGADPTLFAAFAGKLSTRPPSSFLQPPPEGDPPSTTPSATLTLYLEPAQVKIEPRWQAMCAAMAARLSPTPPPLHEAADIISCFVYRNVDAAEAKRRLCPKLKVARRAADCGPDSRDWAAFLAGDGALLVKADDPIGAAGAPYLRGTPAGRLHVAVGLRTRFGMDDPGTWYADPQTPTDPDGAALGTTLLQRRLPLIDPARAPADVGADRLWPWSALTRYQHDHDLSYADWRALGEAQKTLYRSRLLRRRRPTAATDGTPRFEFDVDDSLNLFQLEAVAEFYVNFDEPWNSQRFPTAPVDLGYERLNFLSLFGTGATVAGTVVSLDGQPDMSRICTGRDTIELTGETLRAGKQFRIVGVDRAAGRVTVDRAPSVSGASGWRIHHNPILVIIDAFGSRIRGAAAVPDGNRRVRLEALTDSQLTELERVNPYETVSFDSADGRQHDVRIVAVAVDRPARTATLELDADVLPAASGSAWAIPAGAGGVTDGIRQPYERASARWGWNHYDGLTFVVGDGGVVATLPWSTYTSRVTTDSDGRETGTKYHSSVRGNKRYRIASVFSGKKFINVAWRVVEPDGLLAGDVAFKRTAAGAVSVEPDITLSSTLVRKYQTIHFLSPTPPRFAAAGIGSVDKALNRLKIFDKHEDLVPLAAPYWVYVHDGVRHARHYFSPGLDLDEAPYNAIPPAAPGALGKGAIRIHMGGTKRDVFSQGCIVSPYQPALRNAMTWLHARANVTFYLEHPAADRVRDMDSMKQPPPLIAAYHAELKKLDAMQKTLNTLLADPMAEALDTIRRAGSSNSDTLRGLQAAIDELSTRTRFALESGDEETDSRLAPILADLLDLAQSEDVQTAVELARPSADEIGQLRQELDTLKAATDAERTSWGWDDAIHGDLYVIRPDERSE